MIIYYSNETSRLSADTDNYRRFISALTLSQAPSAQEIRNALIDDFQSAEYMARSEIDSLAGISKKLGADLFVFANFLALDNKYLYLGPHAQLPELRGFFPPEDGYNMLLKHAPLSRFGQFEWAMASALKDGRKDGSRVILIVRSHGSHGMALMPRVNFDFTGYDVNRIVEILNGVSNNDLDIPEVKLQGVTQAQFWGGVSNASRGFNAQFLLVVLSSCESGPVDLGDVFSIPWSVKRIVHSGRSGMSSQGISYKEISKYIDTDSFSRFSDELAVALVRSGQPLEIDTPTTAFRWPIMAFLRGVPYWVYWIPAVVYLIFLFLPFIKGFFCKRVLSSRN